MKIEIDAAKIAELLHEHEDRQARDLGFDANHQLANVVDMVSSLGKEDDPLSLFICQYGLYALGLADSPFSDEAGEGVNGANQEHQT